MKTGAARALLILMLTAIPGCAWEGPFRKAPGPLESALPQHMVANPWIVAYARLLPDLRPVVMRVCRVPSGTYVGWDVLITLKNFGGDRGLDIDWAPVDVYVDFDPNRPYGYDPVTADPETLADHPELLRDMPEQQWMTVPRMLEIGWASFRLYYPDGGPGSKHRRVPTTFTVLLDQYRGGAPGLVTESNEGNNGVSLTIDRYDEISGSTGTYAVWCWFNS